MSLLRSFLCLLCGLLWMGAPVLAGQGPVDVDLVDGRMDVSRLGLVYEDPTGALTIEEVHQLALVGRFEQRDLSPGFSRSVFWVRYRLRNPSLKPLQLWFDTGNHTAQRLSLFRLDDRGRYEEQFAGADLPFAQRPLPFAKVVFPMGLPASAESVVYLRVQATGVMPLNRFTLKPQLWTPSTYQQLTLDGRAQWHMYLGMAAALCLFNFILFVAVRDANYLLYLISLLSTAWAVSCAGGGNGWSYQLLWPDSPMWEQLSWTLSPPAAYIGISAFAWRFLGIRAFQSRMVRSTQLMIGAMTAIALFRSAVTLLRVEFNGLAMEWAFRLGNALMIPTLLLLVGSVILLARQGSRSAKILLFAWAPLFLGAGTAAVRVVSGEGPQPVVIMWASGLELVLMSLALADRFNQERRGRLDAQAELLSNLRKSERELEVKVQQRTQELSEEKARTQELLHNMLPSEIAGELSATGSTRPVRHESITVLFTDFSGFTQVASTMPADRMVAELNEVFAAFDDICDEEGVEKIKTIGDAYMAAAGLPKPCADHAQRCVRAGLRMAAFVEKRNADSAFKWRLRVGIHSGPVIAGVVGKRKYAFDIWGDTVNIASRMESSGEAGRVNVSAYTYDLIRKEFECEYRGRVDAKGKGAVDMYFVEGGVRLAEQH